MRNIIIISLSLLILYIVPSTKKHKVHKKTAVSSCFSDGEVVVCRRTWLKQGKTPMQDIEQCWIEPNPKINLTSFAISCEKYEEIRYSLGE